MRYFSVLSGLILMLFATTAEARHQSYRLDTGSLDDEIVEEFPIPVLFGIDFEDIISDFGDPRGSNGEREHEGQDLFAQKGTPIVSPTDAVVTGVGKTDRDSAGKYVYTVNPGGESFRYMHLDTVADLERGDELEAGDFVGTVGDTGNAPPGVYHLHFEIRDEDREALDPYERLTDEFTLKEKISFLDDVFSQIRNDDEYAKFLVDTYPREMAEALKFKYELPRAIKEALADSEIGKAVTAEAKLAELLSGIPILMANDLSEGDSGPLVQLLQLYLIYYTEGKARDQLAVVGATGYFGPVTTAVLKEFQSEADIEETGAYDARTRQSLAKQ